MLRLIKLRLNLYVTQRDKYIIQILRMNFLLTLWSLQMPQSYRLNGDMPELSLQMNSITAFSLQLRLWQEQDLLIFFWSNFTKN